MYEGDNHLHKRIKIRWIPVLMVLDVFCMFACYFLALLIRFDFEYSQIPAEYLMGYVKSALIYSVCALIIFYVFRLYHGVWKFAGVSEMTRLIGAFAVLEVAAWMVHCVMRLRMPYSYWLMGGLMSFCAIAAVRFSYRFFHSSRSVLLQRFGADVQERIMVIGAGQAGKTIIHELLNSDKLDARICCIIDDDRSKHGRLLEGIPIVGNSSSIRKNVIAFNITKIIYAIPTAKRYRRKRILEICQDTGCTVQVVPGIYQLVDGEVSVSGLRPVQIEDLLGRDEIIVDNAQIRGFVKDKVVMVTGGGGSIGSELCRQIAQEEPKLLIIFDIYENNAYEIQQELKRSLPDLQLETLIGSVRNTNRVESILKKYKPEVVFHAAAHKHVPLMEDSPNEAIKNNVFGTYKMAKAAAANGVRRFILISTDKAVNPTNIMGASKRLCEMVVQMMNRRSATEFVAVRFGNVLGSNGSVIPLFKKQIAEGGPVTVTDPNIIRYFMTIPEAVQLVLQAAVYAQGGEIFVLDMGDPVKIDDMARRLIRLSGYEPDIDIPVVYTGLRPGEKLFEEMLMDEEGLKETPNQMIHIGQPIEMDDEAFLEQLRRLEKACKGESDRIRDLVAEMVPTYHPKAREKKAV